MNLFFELIQTSLGLRKCLSKEPTEKEWTQLYLEAEKQSLIGITFAGIEMLPNDQHPSELLLMKWYGMSNIIKNRNIQVTKAVDGIRKHFDEEGFDMVLLKGQGNELNYPESLGLYRTSGDIDAWIMPKNFNMLSLSERLNNDQIVLNWSWRRDPTRRHCYIHVDYPDFDGVPIEVHFRPSYINSRFRNQRFQKWMMQLAPEQVKNVRMLPESNVEVAVPTDTFNIVYQLSHLYRHIFDDGLGLRQILDYYFVLKHIENNENIDKKEIFKLIKSFGMSRFASALMYVIAKVFTASDSDSIQPWMVTKPDKAAGDFLLQDIMQVGNFGHHDKNIKYTENENGFQRLIRRQKRNMKFLSYYAEEVISVPIYRVYQEYWRVKMNFKCR